MSVTSRGSDGNAGEDGNESGGELHFDVFKEFLAED